MGRSGCEAGARCPVGRPVRSDRAGSNPRLNQPMPEIKVKPWGQGQGEFVEIEAADFDPEFHTLFEPVPVAIPARRGRPPKPPVDPQ